MIDPWGPYKLWAAWLAFGYFPQDERDILETVTDEQRHAAECDAMMAIWAAMATAKVKR